MEYSVDFEAEKRLDVALNPDKYYSSLEFARALNVAESTIRVWIKRGKLPSAVKLGRVWFIPKDTEVKKRCNGRPKKV